MSIQRGVILIKDNLLAKRNWSGSKKCPFCDLNETIQHLFFDCQHAKTIWRVVHVATGLTPPKSIRHMLRNWLTGISKQERSLIFVGAAALMWAICCTRNDLTFEKKIYLIYASCRVLATILVPAIAWGYKKDYLFGEQGIGGRRLGYLCQERMEKQ